MIRREDYEDSQAFIRAQVTYRRRKIQLIVGTVIAVIFAVLLFIYVFFKVRTVTVEGSTRYTNEQIAGFVMTGFLGDNSLVLSMRYRDKTVRDVPFIEKMDVAVVSHDAIHIKVYERSIAGYIDYLGRYIYFSREGTVVESSDERLTDIPEIVGLKFDSITLYQKLPLEDNSIFARVLNTTQLLQKYDLQADKIYFDDNGKMSIYFGNIRVSVGGEDYMDEKISNISRILPSLADKKGTLEMAQYTPDTKYITFIVRGGGAAGGEVKKVETDGQ